LEEGVDYEVGDAFPGSEGGNQFHTARILGNPVETTIEVIDKVGFLTQSGTPRWSTPNISQEQWEALEAEWSTASRERKIDIIEAIYKGEGGNGSLIGDDDKRPIVGPPAPEQIDFSQFIRNR